MVKRVVIFTKPKGLEELRVFWEEVKVLFENFGVKVEVLSHESELKNSSDLILTFGGDGTFLGVARRNIKLGIPILGVYFGNLGFLAEIGYKELVEKIEMLVKSEFEVKERMAMEIVVNRSNKREFFTAVNEVVFRGKSALSYVHFKLNINDKYTNSYHGDGVIASTPTGSTGYNLSAGGPVVYPFSKNLIFTPICSHSLTQRSLVLPTGVLMKVEMEVPEQKEKVVMVIDGQDEVDLTVGEKIELCESSHTVRSVCWGDRDFFEVLRGKLSWGDHR